MSVRIVSASFGRDERGRALAGVVEDALRQASGHADGEGHEHAVRQAVRR